MLNSSWVRAFTEESLFSHEIGKISSFFNVKCVWIPGGTYDSWNIINCVQIQDYLWLFQLNTQRQLAYVTLESKAHGCCNVKICSLSRDFCVDFHHFHWTTTHLQESNSASEQWFEKNDWCMRLVCIRVGTTQKTSEQRILTVHTNTKTDIWKAHGEVQLLVECLNCLFW